MNKTQRIIELLLELRASLTEKLEHERELERKHGGVVIELNPRKKSKGTGARKVYGMVGSDKKTGKLVTVIVTPYVEMRAETEGRKEEVNYIIERVFSILTDET